MHIEDILVSSELIYSINRNPLIDDMKHSHSAPSFKPIHVVVKLQKVFYPSRSHTKNYLPQM